MGTGLHHETPEEIQNIQNNAEAASQPPIPETIKKRRTKKTLSAPVWAHFKKGAVQEDGSYTATCLYCGHVYPMGNQRGTGNMRNHIKRGCKKVPPSKRHKPDALQKILQAGRDEAGQPTIASWVFDQRKCRKSLARCIVAHEYPFNCANHHFLKGAISRYALLDSNFELFPSDLEWEHVKALVSHLKLFYDVTNKLSGTKYPTLNIFFAEYCEVYLNLMKMSTSPYVFVVNMSKEMIKKWDKYWKARNVVLAVACVLDPRCKLDVVEYYFKMLHPQECPRFMANLKACFNQLFKEYSDAYSKDNQANNSTTSTSELSSSDISDTRAGLKNFLSGKRNVEPTKSELDEYLSDALDGTSLDVDFDILAWWKLKAPKYPIMSRLTRDILAVPISTVASESTFSVAGRTLSPTRNSLNDESLEALICAQDWLKASVTETGGYFGDVVWSSEPSDDTICGSQP
ncbi:hypothetical protein LUZ63_018324 [Rhynchospora breviuscula]|uniref:BED-type domain-containing protein n=1 Tax=Rhynchospora breviuscula TaxID=2022672 RepID=A0A9Q0C468_9POAL|nr:hypothetical protein LUZ63_018324 [Rhynchospora breviuscula]